MDAQGAASEGQVGPWVRSQDLLSTPHPGPLEKRVGVAVSPPPNGTCAFSAPPPQARRPRSRRETSEGGTSFPACLHYLCGFEL